MPQDPITKTKTYGIWQKHSGDLHQLEAGGKLTAAAALRATWRFLDENRVFGSERMSTAARKAVEHLLQQEG